MTYAAQCLVSLCLSSHGILGDGDPEQESNASKDLFPLLSSGISYLYKLSPSVYQSTLFGTQRHHLIWGEAYNMFQLLEESLYGGRIKCQQCSYPREGHLITV